MGSKPAGSKATWRGADEMRPLSTLGLAQARSLVTTLAGDTVTALWCSPSVRCRQSLEPLAAALALPERTTARLSKTAHPRRLLTWLQEVGVDASWVVCTHGEVITALYAATRHAEIVGLAPRTPTEKGAVWRLGTDSGYPSRLVHLAYTPPSPRH